MIVKPYMLRAFMLLLLFNSFMVGWAKEDDDLIGEIAIDLFVGGGMAICGKFVLCNIILTVVLTIAAILIIIVLCAGEISLAELCNLRVIRRGLTSAIGYGGAKLLFRG